MTNKTIAEILHSVRGDNVISDHERLSIDQATQAITQAMLDALPEKQRIDSSIIRDDNELSYLMKLQISRGDGFNQAISEMETAIKKMGGE